MTPLIRLLLVDDDPLVRSALRTMIGEQPDIVITGEAGSGTEAVEESRRHAPDVVLMDIQMSDQDGIEATAALRRLPQPPHVLVLTTFDTDPNLLAALEAGADGFLVKRTPPARIVEAIRATARGEPVLSSRALRSLISTVVDPDRTARRTDARERLDRLTDRERDVAESIADGLTNPEIARKLYLSVSSVKVHVSTLLTKLSATNRTRIAVIVHESRRRPRGDTRM